MSPSRQVRAHETKEKGKGEAPGALSQVNWEDAHKIRAKLKKKGRSK